ncbi:hypothetical protein TRIP_C21296 [Candidatus Zixiibacteriota bacterium]|nr:hypothetical protein TRIP_C21296 [candidate division Zixibacteria bacterium]
MIFDRGGISAVRSRHNNIDVTTPAVRRKTDAGVMHFAFVPITAFYVVFINNSGIMSNGRHIPE